jgi:hypothetical protein
LREISSDGDCLLWEEFFDCIDSHEKAHLLGFLYADGANDESRGALTIKLQAKDREFLEKIKAILKSEHHLKTLSPNPNILGRLCKVQEQVYLSIVSRKISNALKKLGCVQNKSAVVRFPTGLFDKVFFNSFLLGYLEGDGGISVSGNGKCFGIHFCGNFEFLSGIQKYLSGELGIDTKIKKDSKSKVVYAIHFGGSIQTLKFLDHLYKDSKNFYMLRKYERYKRLEALLRLKHGTNIKYVSLDGRFDDIE